MVVVDANAKRFDVCHVALNFSDHYKIKILSEVVVVNPNGVLSSTLLLISLNIKVLA